MTELLPVTQADREAAAQFVEDCQGQGFRAGHHHNYRAGIGDASKLVQAFARHRLAAEARTIQPDTRMEGVRALKWLASERTVEELLRGDPSDWGTLTPIERVKAMGERKAVRDAAILDARSAMIAASQAGGGE